MKRPLALFGYSVLLVLLLAGRLPAAFMLPLALGAAAAFVVCLGLAVKKHFGNCVPLAVVTAAVALSLGWRLAYDAMLLRPLEALDGREALAVARVEDATPAYGGDTVDATLAVLSLDGEAPPRSFKVKVRSIPEVKIGDIVQADMRLYGFGTAGTRDRNYAKGFALGASLSGQPAVVGQDLTLLCRFRLLRYAAGDAIKSRLPMRLSSVAAAMAVGDMRALSYETRDAYRTAGLSHLLVVSGLHLSIVSGLAYALVRRLVRRRWKAAVAGMAVVLFFMLLTGLTPSIMRSGIVCLVVYTGQLLRRPADVYTSLALAAVVLCAGNPYAAQDAGLLLSFTATLGPCWAGASLCPRQSQTPAGSSG